MLKKIKMKRIKENLSMMILTLVIIGIGLYRINEQIAPIILMDEFGYWSNAAFFAGLDWSEINQFNNYYSYGYSIFLALLIKVFGTSSFLYKSAILLNIIMMVFTFLMLRQIGKIMFPKISDKLITICSFITILYPSFQANIHIAWSETALVCFFTSAFYLLLMYLKKKKILCLYLFLSNCFFCYIIHQRCLGILFAGVFILVVLTCNENISIKKLLCMLLLLLGLVIGHSYIKNILLSEVFVSATNSSANANDYSSIFEHIIVWSNYEGIKKLFFSVLGKLLYLFIATMGLLPMSIIYFFDSKMEWRSLFKVKKINKGQIVAIFLILSLFFTVMIASVFTLNAMRLDVLVYGRYTEWLLAPFILIGLLFLYKNLKGRKYLWKVGTIILFLCCIVMQEYIRHPEWDTFFDICSLVMAYFRKFDRNSYSFLFLAALGCATFILLASVTKKKNMYIFIVILYLVWILPCSWWCINRVLGSNYRSEICLQMDEYISEEDKIYFVYDGTESLWYVADLQVMNPYLKFINIDAKQIQEVSGYILVSSYNVNNKNYIDEAVVANFQISLIDNR